MSSPGSQNIDNRHGRPTSSRPRWEHPEESCGGFITKLPGPGAKSVWMAVGRAAHVWQNTLSPRIRKLLEDSDAFYGTGVSLFMYMIGRDKSKASPRIIFCSSNVQARKAARQAVEDSGILRDFPAIGLGDSSSPLARADSGLRRQPLDPPTLPRMRSRRAGRTRDADEFQQEPSGHGRLNPQSPEALAGRTAPEVWQAVPHESAVLIHPFQGLSIAGYCPSRVSLDDSAYGTGSVGSNASRDRTPRSSMHDMIHMGHTHSSTSTIKGLPGDTPDSADDRESYSESDDMDDPRSSNTGGLLPIIARELGPLVRKLLAAFYSHRQLTAETGNRDACGAGSSKGSSTRGSSQNQRGGGDGALQGGRGKRAFPDSEQNDRGGDLATDPKRTKMDQQRERVFACPYWKKDPHTYRRCFRLELKAVKRVKQHLYRSHARKIYCPRCQDEFPTRTQCDDHVRAVDCRRRPRVVDEGINEEQVAELSKKGPVVDQAERWYTVWRIVFPGLSPPVSPYIDDELSEDMSEFREFFQRHGSKLILDHMRTGPNWSLDDEERFSQETWELIFSEALDGIERRWRSLHAHGSGETPSGAPAEPLDGELLTHLALNSSPSPPSGEGVGGVDASGFHLAADSVAPGTFQVPGVVGDEDYNPSDEWLGLDSTTWTNNLDSFHTHF